MPHDMNSALGAVDHTPKGQSRLVSGAEPHSEPTATAGMPRGRKNAAAGSEPNSAPQIGDNLPQGQPRDVCDAEPNSEPMAEHPVPQGQGGDAVGSEPPSGDAASEEVPQGYSRPAASPDINTICITLQSLQRERRFYIRAQQRLDRATESFIAMALGFEARNTEKWEEGDKKAAKALFALAKKIRMSVERGEAEVKVPQGQRMVASRCAPLILSSAMAREHFDKGRKQVEDEMASLAKTLPVYPWIKQVLGVKAKGLAIVVAEAGNLSGYPKKGHLWKRLGLAVYDGKRQGSVPNALSSQDKKDAWKLRGYDPTRRAEMFALFDDVMLRAQWRADKDEDGKNPVKTGKPVAVPGHPIGPYGAHYARKKAEYVAIEKPYADKSARRYMTKMFIRDLWNAWRAADVNVPQGQ